MFGEPKKSLIKLNLFLPLESYLPCLAEIPFNRNLCTELVQNFGRINEFQTAFKSVLTSLNCIAYNKMTMKCRHIHFAHT